MQKLFLMIVATTLCAAPLAAHAQDWGGRGEVGVGVRLHAGGGYYNDARRYDRGDRDAWRDWDERDGLSGRDGLSYGGRWSDRDGWGDDGRPRDGFDVGVGYGDGGYPSLADDEYDRPGDYGAGYAYSYPDAHGTYQPFAYDYSPGDDAYYANDGRGGGAAYYGYQGAPNRGWSAGAPPADCGRWLWREGRGAYEWVARPC